MKKILVTRKLLKECEEKALKNYILKNKPLKAKNKMISLICENR